MALERAVPIALHPSCNGNGLVWVGSSCSSPCLLCAAISCRCSDIIPLVSFYCHQYCRRIYWRSEETANRRKVIRLKLQQDPKIIELDSRWSLSLSLIWKFADPPVFLLNMWFTSVSETIMGLNLFFKMVRLGIQIFRTRCRCSVSTLPLLFFLPRFVVDCMEFNAGLLSQKAVFAVNSRLSDFCVFCFVPVRRTLEFFYPEEEILLLWISLLSLCLGELLKALTVIVYCKKSWKR